MPENRTIAACIALSIMAHLMALIVASAVKWTPGARESVMVVDLADIPRAEDFLPPRPGMLEGGRVEAPPPPVPAREKRIKPKGREPVPPGMMEGRVPDLPVDPSLAPEKSFQPIRGKEAPPSASVEEAGQRKTGPSPEKQAAPAKEPSASPGSSGKPLKDLNPSLGKMVMAMGDTGGRGTGSTKGNAVGTGGKPGDKGGIVEEGGGGARLTALNAPEIQYISYFAGIKRKIELVWGYPAGAAGIEGDVIVDFVIGRSGKLESVTLVRGSGQKILDEEALGAIRKAAPYSPIPSQYKIANLQIRAHFYYTVTHTRILR